MTGFPGGDAAGVVHLEAKPRLGIRGGKKEEEGEEGLFFKANSMVACPVIVGLGRSATRIKISRRLDDRRMRDSQPASAQARARACACDSNAKFSSSKILIGTSLKRVFCSSLHIKSLYGKYMSPHQTRLLLLLHVCGHNNTLGCRSGAEGESRCLVYWQWPLQRSRVARHLQQRDKMSTRVQPVSQDPVLSTPPF